MNLSFRKPLIMTRILPDASMNGMMCRRELLLSTWEPVGVLPVLSSKKWFLAGKPDFGCASVVFYSSWEQVIVDHTCRLDEAGNGIKDVPKKPHILGKRISYGYDTAYSYPISNRNVYRSQEGHISMVDSDHISVMGKETRSSWMRKKKDVTVRSASPKFTRAEDEDARDGNFFTVYCELIRYRSVVILPERLGCSNLP